MRIEDKIVKAIQVIVPNAEFALRGESLQPTPEHPDWGIEWLDARPQPTDQQIMSKVTEMNLDQVEADENTRRNLLRNDAGVVELRNRINTATPAQIDSWLTANVTNLAQARVVLAQIVKLLAT